MTVARLYRMTAAEGRGDELADALTNVASVIRAAPGSEGVEVLRDAENPLLFTFIEKWVDIAAHQAAPGHLPKGSLDPVAAAMAGPPEGAYLNYLRTV